MRLPLLVRVAWRNLWRHRTRTLIMTSAVAFTYALMLVGLGISDDAHGRMLEEAGKAAGGEILIHGRGYWESRASDLFVDDVEGVLGVVAGVEEVRVVLPRVLVSGLVSSARGNRAVLLQGIDPQQERSLGDPASDLVRGGFLSEEAEGPLVLGSRLVQELEVEVGDRVVLTATGPDGEVTRALFHLSGVVETGTRELNEVLGYTTIAAARSALGLESRLTQVGVLLEEGAPLEAVAGRLRVALDSRDSGSGGGLEVLTWPEAVPEMVGFIELDDAFGYIYMAVIFLIVLFSIANTFLMAVMERVRELGLLSALGLRGGRLGALLLTETGMLTALAMAVGLTLGTAGHLAVGRWGISVAIWGVEELEISGVDFADLVMYSQVEPTKWLIASGFVALATLSSALYPAWRAARLAPAEAMRFFE